MPSFQHELFVELFRNRPELARELLRLCAGLELEGSSSELGATDLSQLVPAQFLADGVVIFRNGDDPSAAVIVEVQLSTDPDKRFSWPVYVAALRAKLRCPVFLLVLAPDEPVAQWAREGIALGHPGFLLEPIAITYGDVPRITDPAAALAAPELAVLSVLGHPDLEVADAALAAISSLPEDHQALYFDVVLRAIPDHVRGVIEARMLKYEYQSDFARKYFSQGLEQGLEQGLGQGLERGMERGTEQGLQMALVGLARARLGALGADDEAKVHAIHDVKRLLDLISALGGAPTAEEARAVLDRLAYPVPDS